MKNIRSEFLLLITAILWGFAFSFQKMGMQYIGPFAFNGVRFFIGGSFLLTLEFIFKGKKRALDFPFPLIRAGLILGSILFFGATFQQVGIIFTTSGKAGFITGLYILIVPIIGLFLGDRFSIKIVIGAVVAAVGLYFLTVSGEFDISKGDVLVFAGTFFWATHILAISHFVKRFNPIKLAISQFFVCSFINIFVSAIFERTTTSQLFGATVPILYGGFIAIGIAYTLQVVAQKKVHHTLAAIIFSLESVFAVVGGYLLLGELLTGRMIFGSILILTGIVVSQLDSKNI